MEARTLVTLVDADDCIYNPVYRFLFLHVLDKYGDFIWTYAHKSDLSKEDEAFIDGRINEMISEIDAITQFNPETGKVLVKNFSNTEYERLINSLLNRGGFRTNDPDEKECFASGTINIFRQYIQQLGGNEFLKTLLFVANKPFFNQIESKCQTENICKLILMSGSNRQSTELDKLNSEENGTGLFSQDLHTMKELFDELFKKDKIKCKVDDFLMENIYGSENFFDHTKFSVLYALLNRIAIKNKNEKIDVILLEDKRDIITALQKIFSMHKDLISKNLTLILPPPYFGGIEMKDSENISTIRITGTRDLPDHNYLMNVKKIALLWNPNLQTADTIIQAVDDLMAKGAIDQFKKDCNPISQPTYPALMNIGLAMFNNNHSQPSQNPDNSQEQKKRCVII